MNTASYVRRSSPILAGAFVFALAARFAGAQGADPDADQLRNSRSFDFGAFCISDIPHGMVANVGPPDFTSEGVWRDVTIEVPGDAPAKPRMFVFRDVRSAPGYTGCRSTLPSGVTRVLEGDIRHGTVRFRLLQRPVAGLTIASQIDHGELDVNLVRLRSDFNRLYGGSVTPDGSELHVTNVGPFVANQRNQADPNDNLLSGTLRVGSTALRLVNAKVQLPGATSPITATFATPSGVALDVAIPSGALSLHKGTFRATRVPFGPADLQFAGIEAAGASGTIGTLDIVGTEGVGNPHARLATLAARVTRLTETTALQATVVPEGPVAIDALEGALTANNTVAAFGAVTARGINVPRGALALGGAADAPYVSGRGALNIALVDTVTMDATVKVERPAFASAAIPLPDFSGRSLALTLRGARAAPSLTGSLELERARFATLALRDLRNVVARLHATLGSGEIAIPFAFDTATPSGSWSLVDPSGAEVTLEGQLKRLRAAGTLFIGDAQTTRVVVDPGAFALDATGTAVRRSLIFGAPPATTTLSGDLSVGSRGGFSVGRPGVSGRLELALSMLAVNSPQLVFDAPGGVGFEIQAPLRFAAGVTLGVDLSSLDVSLLSGHAELAQVAAKSTTTAPVKLADLELSAPALTLETLTVDAANERASVRGTGLDFTATGVRHTKDPQWDIAAVNPRLPVFSAELGSARNAVTVLHAVVEQVNLSAASGSYHSQDGFVVAGRGMSVTAARMTEDAIVDAAITVQHGSLSLHYASPTSETTGAAQFSGFHVTATGPKDGISGTGSLRFDNLDVSHQFAVLQNKCGNDLRLNANAAIGSIDVGIALTAGRLHGRARVDRPQLRVRNTAYNTCEFNETYPVAVIQVVPREVCWIPAPLLSEICKYVSDRIAVTIPVPVRWRAQIVHLDVPAHADHADLELHGSNGVGVCVVDAKLDTVGRFEGLSMTPTFEARGDLGELVKATFDATWKFTLGSLESAIATTFTNIGGLFTAIAPQDFCNRG